MSSQTECNGLSTKGKKIIPVRSYPLLADEEYLLKPDERRYISTGFHFNFPDNFCGIIFPSTKLMSNKHLDIPASIVSPMTHKRLDPIEVLMLNKNKEPVTVEKNEEIGLMVVQKLYGNTDFKIENPEQCLCKNF